MTNKKEQVRGLGPKSAREQLDFAAEEMLFDVQELVAEEMERRHVTKSELARRLGVTGQRITAAARRVEHDREDPGARVRGTRGHRCAEGAESARASRYGVYHQDARNARRCVLHCERRARLDVQAFYVAEHAGQSSRPKQVYHLRKTTRLRQLMIHEEKDVSVRVSKDQDEESTSD